jgi:hypothetical protein
MAFQERYFCCTAMARTGVLSSKSLEGGNNEV